MSLLQMGIELANILPLRLGRLEGGGVEPDGALRAAGLGQHTAQHSTAREGEEQRQRELGLGGDN
jgi:hypothetical protein